MVNFERSFCDVEVGDGSVGMNAICSRPEANDDVISIKDVDTFGVTLLLRCGLLSSLVFEKIDISY